MRDEKKALGKAKFAWSLGYRTEHANRYEAARLNRDYAGRSVNGSLLSAPKYGPAKQRGRLLTSMAVFLAAVATSASIAQSTGQSKDREQVLLAMSKAADQVSIEAIGEPGKVSRMEKPLFHFDDPARNFDDGSIWAWGQTGRPVALVTIARNSPSRWMVETVSFADAPIKVGSVSLGGKVDVKSLEDAEPPHEAENLRKSQLKLIARKFQAYQMWDNDGATKLQRYELRLLTKPILEYSDKKKGVLNGAVFLFNYGSNPELVMILEAHTDGWKCGFGRMGWAAANVEYRKKPVFQQPKLRTGIGDDRYAMTVVAADRQAFEELVE